MKKLLLVSLILCLGMFAMADTVALLSASKGKVNLERESNDIEFKKGELLHNSDVLRTGPESFAAYKFIDASSLVKLFSNSVVTINADKKDGKLAKRVKINQGSVLSTIKSGTGSFSVQTPTTVASVKGTEFMTRVDDDGNSIFIVTDGEVDLRVMATDERMSVGKGKTATVDPEGETMLQDSTPEDLDSIELSELEGEGGLEKNTILIPVLDDAGNTKYIKITY